MAGILSKERLIQGFHKLECDFFHRLVHDLGQDPTNMRWVIAFWLWLESAGHHDFVRRAYALPGPVVLRFVEEAVACLRCLAGEAPDLEDARVAGLPCTNAFLAQPVDDVAYFVDRRDTVLKGVNYLYKTVCLVVCLGSRGPADNDTTRAAPTQTIIGSPARSDDGEVPRRPRGELPTTPTLLKRSPATRASTQMMISSPRHAAPQMVSSHVHAAPQMMSSTYHAAPPAYAPPLMMSAQPEYAPPLMMSAPPAYAPQLMMTTPPAYAPPLMISAPPAYAPPLMMPAPPAYAPAMMMTSPPVYAAPMPLSTLNPMASPWVPIEVVQATLPEDYSSPLPEDYRSLFVTFSKGYPVSKEEILEFFNSTFGPCVETVMLEKVQPGQVPMYGRLVLRDAEMISVVLEGQQTNKFLINGRHLWARVYVPSSRVDVFA
ncbi:hypothetical protein QOZ80_2AG0116620 [Eleusine coracana subsp. coracana]|nr:hypothetical protein QOZ80_2AG0116620 [Eleusine coracana subsp. coracana]